MHKQWFTLLMGIHEKHKKHVHLTSISYIGKTLLLLCFSFFCLFFFCHFVCLMYFQKKIPQAKKKNIIHVVFYCLSLCKLYSSCDILKPLISLAAVFMNICQQYRQSSTYIIFILFCLLHNTVAQRDQEPLYQFWVWYLGVISHVGHQLAKKRGPLWDAHLFSALGQAQSQRAAGMKGWVWEGPAEKTRVGGSIRTQSVCGAPAVLF